MDHVVPVVEGGGECGLDGLRTLCVPCHRKVTLDLLWRLHPSAPRAIPPGQLSLPLGTGP
jgi:5-methylcytosine-specific restriction enzyme A